MDQRPTINETRIDELTEPDNDEPLNRLTRTNINAR